MHLTFAVDSNILSGLAILIFNVVFLALCRFACQSISASYNIHTLHDKHLRLSPRRSRLAAVFGGPVGYLPVSRLLALVILVYEIFAFLLDFSINGSSRTYISPTPFKSLVVAHPEGIPLKIDYLNEYNDTKEASIHTPIQFASERLVAIAEAQACKVLNFSHHINLAYAYENVSLSSTKLIPIRTFVDGGECVTQGPFENDMVSHAFAQSAPGFDCDFSDTVISTDNCTYPSGAGVCEALISGTDPNCGATFFQTRCYRRINNVEHCVTVAEYKSGNDTAVMYNLFKSPNDSYPTDKIWLRDIPNLSRDDYGTFAANMAYFSALNFKYHTFNDMFMAVATIERNVLLPRTKRVNTTEINLDLAVPALVALVILLGMLITVLKTMRYCYVVRPERTNFVSFANINEVFNFDNNGHLTKTKAAQSQIRYVKLKNNHPVLLNEPPEEPP